MVNDCVDGTVLAVGCGGGTARGAVRWKPGQPHHHRPAVRYDESAFRIKTVVLCIRVEDARVRSSRPFSITPADDTRVAILIVGCLLVGLVADGLLVALRFATFNLLQHPN